MLPLGEAQQRRAQQRTAAEVERPPRLGVRQALRASPPAPARRIAERSICVERRSRSSGAMTCTGSPSTPANVVRSTSWRRTISWSARSSAPASRAPDRRTRDRQVVGRASGLELVQEPEPLLREGQRQVAVPGHRHDLRGHHAAGAAQGALDLRRPSRQASSVSNRLRTRQLDAEGGAGAGDHLGGEQRMAAELEEVVRRADRLAAQDLAPDLGQPPPPWASAALRRRCPRIWRAPRDRSRRAPGGPPCRWAGSGSAPRRAHSDGTMYSGRRSRRCERRAASIAL